MSTSALKYMGAVTANTRAKATEILAAVEAAGHNLGHIWGKDNNAGNVEHYTGRALDFMVYRADGSIDSAAGDFIANYLWTHRARLGLRHEIWRQRIRSTAVSPGVWRVMGDRGTPTKNHMDHVHVLFGSDAYVPPSGKPAPPAPGGDGGPRGPFPLPIFYGAAGKDDWYGVDDGTSNSHSGARSKDRTAVLQIQREVGTVADGRFGANTYAAVVKWQLAYGLKGDGEVGPVTWLAMTKK